MKVANAEYISTIICRETQRKDTAIYTITVSNDHGSDSADIELIVLGRYLAVVQYLGVKERSHVKYNIK